MIDSYAERRECELWRRHPAPQGLFLRKLTGGLQNRECPRPGPSWDEESTWYPRRNPLSASIRLSSRSSRSFEHPEETAGKNRPVETSLWNLTGNGQRSPPSGGNWYGPSIRCSSCTSNRCRQDPTARFALERHRQCRPSRRRSF